MKTDRGGPARVDKSQHGNLNWGDPNRMDPRDGRRLTGTPHVRKENVDFNRSPVVISHMGHLQHVSHVWMLAKVLHVGARSLEERRNLNIIETFPKPPTEVVGHYPFYCL